MMNRWLLTTLFIIGSSLAETRVPFNVRVTKNSATIYKINLNEESNQPTLAEASNVKLFFHEEAGTPEWSSDCPEKSHCLRWMKNGKTNGEMIIYPFNSVPSNPDNRWQVTTNGPPHTYVIDYDGYYLYGGPLDYIYPSNADVKINAPSVTSEGGVIGVNKARNVVERVWMSTNGHAVRVSEDTPLFFSQNATTLLLTVKSELPYPTDQVNVNSLLTLCLKANVKDAWQCIHQNHYRATPGLEVIHYPTLTTWVTYKGNISQQTVLDFVKTADSHNILASVIGIDDGWETCYGSQIFNNKFPDPKQMVTDLGNMGREVTLWVHPFVNVECEAYDRLKEYLLKYDNGSIVNTTWWNGRGAMINFLDDKATDFYYNRLKKLQTDYGVQGFKFDAGEISYIAELNEALALDLPNKYTQNYVAMAAKFGAIGEVRVGAGTSQEKIRMRLQDTNSVWEQEKGGLKSVIPSMLQLAVIGYDATIPDMVGGNEYGTTVDKEMFIRWLQLSILMPFYQFSIPPWNYDNETVALTRELMDLHSNYSIYMYRIMLDATDIRPIVTPLWWIEPNDKAAQACNDQFLLGDDILVAPVVEKGATSRDIYFPSGYWYDVSANRGYFGPKIEKDFAAPLNKLPWFQRINPYAFFEDRANVKLVP